MEISVAEGKVKVTMKTGFFTSIDEFSLDEEYMKEMDKVWMKVIVLFKHSAL